MLELMQAKLVERDKNGKAWSWVSGPTIAKFNNAYEFSAWVDKNINLLDKNTVAFTGSASLLSDANLYLADKMREVGILPK